MKLKYNKPTVESVELNTATTILSGSVTTGVGNTPSRPDANVHRNNWGDLWNKN
jgi:phage tail sheath protein FI